MRNNFWNRKNVLITGYEGFLGSYLAMSLLGFGAKVVGLDIKTHRKETILGEALRKIKIIKGSVEDYRLVSRIIKKKRIQFVFHLAATSIVGEAFSDPIKAFSTNIQGTWNILESCRRSNAIEAVIVASSDKAYGMHNKLPYRENFSLCGSHPYDVSKSCADLLAHTYFHTYGLPVSVTRCGNIFGPGDFNFSRLTPDAICCALTGKALLIRSDGKFTRDYIYVDDIVNGYLLLAQNLKKLHLAGEAFNFSDENPISVIELVKRVYKLAGKKENYKILNLARFEIRHQYLDSAKARKMLNWKPEFALNEGLKTTIEWYRGLLELKKS